MKISKLFEGQKIPTFIASGTRGELNLNFFGENWLIPNFYPKDMGKVFFSKYAAQVLGTIKFWSRAKVTQYHATIY